MGLSRIYSGVTGLGSLIIKRLGDVGGPPSSRVSEELDALIAWAKDAPRCIHRFAPVTPPGNVGAGVDLLQAFTIDTPNRLLTNGDWIRFALGGEFATSDNDKRIQILFDSQTIEDFGAFDFDAGQWRAVGEIIRVSSTTVRTSYLGVYGEPLVMDEGVVSGTPDVIIVPRSQLLTVSNLTSNAVSLTVNGNGAANDDITLASAIVEVCLQ